MKVQNLRDNYPKLIFHMENNGYSKTYVARFKREIKKIISAESKEWSCYTDVYLKYTKKSQSPDYLRDKRTVIGAIEQFDVHGRYPDGRRRHELFTRGSYPSETCPRLLAFLPALRETRKNIQYLTSKEIQEVKSAMADGENRLTLRDKAIGMLALYTGLRGCDIAGLTLGDIDWDRDFIYIKQQKTDISFELPLTAVVGNAIYDYLTSERPHTESRYIFVSQLKPYERLKN